MFVYLFVCLKKKWGLFGFGMFMVWLFVGVVSILVGGRSYSGEVEIRDFFFCMYVFCCVVFVLIYFNFFVIVVLI